MATLYAILYEVKWNGKERKKTITVMLQKKFQLFPSLATHKKNCRLVVCYRSGIK